MKALKYTSRTGHFNFANPSEESISCHIGISDGEKEIAHTNIRADYEAEGNDVDEAIDLLEAELKKVWISTSKDEWKEMIEFLKLNRDEIETGNREKRKLEIKKEMEKLNKELKSLEDIIK